MVQKILSAGVLRDCAVMSGISKVYCELRAPSLDDERAEFERLADCLALQDISSEAEPERRRRLSRASSARPIIA